jgi:hypothetical protein
MEYELSDEAAKDLDKQAKQSGDDPGEGKDPVEQTVSVPLTGTEKDAVSAVQRQFEEKSGLELPEEVARDIAQEPREKASLAGEKEDGTA